MDRIIEDYKIQLVEPGCGVGSGRWGALVTPDKDISAVFPYLNAVLDNARYDHENQILIWGERKQRYALRPYEIRVAEVPDPQEAQQIVRDLVARVNKVWQERSRITPRFTERKIPPVLDIFRLLPQTNCQQCGYSTCLAYAAALSKGKVTPERCPPVSHADNAEKKQKLLQLTSRD